MMKLIRWILSKIILTLDALFPPKAISRTPEEKARIERACGGLVLYQFEACPFCVKVRRAMRRLGIKAEIKEALAGTPGAEELLKGGGSLQVPCLRIPQPDGSVRWMYESSEIVEYLAGLAS